VHGYYRYVAIYVWEVAICRIEVNIQIFPITSLATACDMYVATACDMYVATTEDVLYNNVTCY